MSNTIDDAIAEAVQIVLGLTPDELQEFARQVAMANSAQADRLADALATVAMVPFDEERHKRVWDNLARVIQAPAGLGDDDVDYEQMLGLVQ